MNVGRYLVSSVIAFVLLLVPSGFASAQASAGITIDPVSGETTEAGGKVTFTIVLNAKPKENVTIGLISSDPSEGGVSPASVTFSSSTWNTPKTITVSGVDDGIDDGDKTYSIITTPSASNDPSYSGINPSDVALKNIDNDTAGFEVSEISGQTNESGTTATFTVRLTSRPERNVNIGINSGDATEGKVSPSLLIFTSANWNTKQTVTVRGVDDTLVDGDITYQVVTAAAISGDRSYDDENPPNVAVTNVNNDVGGFTVTPAGPLTTTEGKGIASFTVVPRSAPASDVSIGISSSDITEGTVSTDSLLFTSANWNTPKKVTITGVNDSVDDGDIGYSIVIAPSVSDDDNFDAIDLADVAVTNKDDDTAGVTLTALKGTVAETGSSATFTVRLNSQPADDVSIALSTSDSTEASVSPTPLIFTSANWKSPQTVSVTGVDDTVTDGDKSFDVVTAAAVSDDENYDGKNAADVAAINRDNEVIKFTAGIYKVNESAGNATIQVVLTGTPEAGTSVKVNYAASDGSAKVGEDFTATSGTLTFSGSQTSRSFQVPLTNDVAGEGDETIKLALSGAINGVIQSPGTAQLIIPANDIASFASATYKFNESSSDILVKVVLNGPSTEDVAVDYATSDGTADAGSDYTAKTGTLTFAAGETSKTIAVHLLDDNGSEPDETFIVTLSNPNKLVLGTQKTTTVTIAANDPIVFNPSSYNVNESAGTVDVIVELSGGAATDTVSVDYATSDGTANAGSDYTAKSGTLTFDAGDTSKTITIVLKEDAALEATEKFLVTLSNPSGGALGNTKSATVNILANDSLAFTSASYSVNEQTALATITVKLNAVSSEVVTVDYATSNGSATAGQDYTAVNGTLTFSPGETSKTFSVAIINDTADEPNETVTLTLSSPTKAGLGQPSATLTIIDNDV